MYKMKVILALFCVIFLASCNNAAPDIAPASNSITPSQTEISGDNNASSVPDDSEGQELEKISILSDKVELLMPESFEIMTEEMAKLKYPSERRPTIIYTNESGSVNIAFNHTENQATSDQLSDYKDSFVETFSNLYPSAQWYRADVETINGADFGVLEMITPAVDTEIYNLMWFTDLDGRLLLATFNCTKEQMDEWKR